MAWIRIVGSVFTLMLLPPVWGQVTPKKTATVWRCGNQYSQTPCADGKVVNTQDPSPAPAGSKLTPSYSAQAAAMERERMALEAQAAKQMQTTPAEFKAPAVADHSHDASKNKKSRKKSGAHQQQAHEPFTARASQKAKAKPQ